MLHTGLAHQNSTSTDVWANDFSANDASVILASLAGHVGGEKTAMYRLLANMRPFQEYFRNIVSSHGQSMWIVSGQSTLVYAHTHTRPQIDCKPFPSNLHL